MVGGGWEYMIHRDIWPACCGVNYANFSRSLSHDTVADVGVYCARQ